MKKISYPLLALMSCLVLYGCSIRPPKESKEISVLDTLGVQITNILKNKKEIENFYSHSNKKPVVVFYSMLGCEPCQEVYPFYKKMAKKYGGYFDFGKEDEIENRTANPRIKSNQIFFAPTAVIWNRDSIVARLEGSKEIASNLENELLEHSH